MMKPNVRLLTVFLALLLLISTVPLAVLAEEEVEPTAIHSHTYTTYLKNDYVWKNNSCHYYASLKVYTCSCGYSYNEILGQGNDTPHYAEIGSKTYLGTFIGENERAYDLYELTCRDCKGTYRITEWKEIID